MTIFTTGAPVDPMSLTNEQLEAFLATLSPKQQRRIIADIRVQKKELAKTVFKGPYNRTKA